MDIYKVALCLTGLSCLSSIVYGCSEEHINTCIQIFSDSVGVSLEELEAGIIPDTTRESLQRACSAYDDFEDCVKTYRGYCPTEVRVQLEGLEDMYDYVCGDGFEEHLKHEECLSSRDVDIKIIECNQQVLRELDTFLLTKDEVCDTMKDSLDCLEDSVESVCGSDAAEHQVEIEKRLLQPLADEFDCDLDGGVNIALICGIIAAIVIIILISVCICLYCAKKNNSRRYADEQQMTNVVVQPGATAPTYPGSVITNPPPYAEYQDPNEIHKTRAPPVYDNPGYQLPSNNDTDSHAYTGLPGKE